MPFYSYICSKCLKTFESFHSITEIITKCEFCGIDNCVLRDYSNFKIVSKIVDEQRNKAIQNVGKTITKMKQDLKDQKKDIKKNLEKEINE